MQAMHPNLALESANYWNQIANEADERADYEESRGSSGSAFRHKATSYRRSAFILWRESQTGKPHCYACLGPHASHEHPHRG